jgi:hypothetical protein
MGAQQQRDEDATDAAVAVEEGMDRLELVVDERESDEQRKRTVRVQELLERIQRRLELVSWRWRDEASLRDLLPVDADGVLLVPELTGAIVTTANSRQEDAMHVLDHAEAHRQRRELLEAVLEGADVVVHFASFAAGGGRKVCCLVQDELLGRGDGPLDPAGHDRFPPLKWADQQVRVLECGFRANVTACFAPS